MAFARATAHVPVLVRNTPAAAGTAPPPHRVPIDDLLTAAFMARHSQFENVGAFLDASGLEPQTLSDPGLRARSQWDRFVSESTDFGDWPGMLQAASGEWMIRRIGLVIED